MYKYETEIKWGDGDKYSSTTLNTDISVDRYVISIICKKEKKTSEKRVWTYRDPRVISSKIFNDFCLQDKQIDIENVSSIKIKYGKVYGIFHLIYKIIAIIVCIYWGYKFFSIDYNFLSFILSLDSSLLLWCTLSICINNICDIFKYRAIQINAHDEKICIPTGYWGYKKDDKLFEFIENLKNINPSIKIKNSINFNKKIKILFFLIFLGLSLTFGYIWLLPINLSIVSLLSIPLFAININFDEINQKIQKNLLKIIIVTLTFILILVGIISSPLLIRVVNNKIEKNREDNIKQSIINDECYTEVDVVKAILKESIKLSNNHVKNTYTIKESGEELEFEETYLTRKLNSEYYIWIFKYYIKQNNNLLVIKYDSFNDENDYNSIYLYNTKYIYDKINNKIIKLYNPESKNMNSFPISFRFYYRKDENKSKDKMGVSLDKIYNRIYSNQLKNLQQENEYNIFKLIDTFNSQYGKCYIVKNDKEIEKIDYYMYIENNNINSSDDYDGMFIIYENNSLVNDNNAIKYFKKVINIE